MSLLEEAKSLLRSHRIKPKKTLGQNFTVESRLFQKMVEGASLNCDDTVLEIGAGLGFLTRFLREKCKAVLAVEVDARLVDILHKQFSHSSNVKIIEGDILKVCAPLFNKSVSVPPYQISSSLLVWLLNRDFDCAVLVFQKEFADRLVAPVGSEAYGWLTVFTHYAAQVEFLDEVPKSVFYPQPKVNSIITRLKPKSPRPFQLDNGSSFQHFLQVLFTHRNKTVRNAVLAYLREGRNSTKKNANRIADAFPFSSKRPRELPPEDIGALANAVIR
jgi:16S rRNA (adenine1518-N6/adenine1519-N6)-dimethyltransferase